MPVIAGEFQDLADEFMDVEFAALAKVLIMKTAEAVTFGSDQTYTSETGTGIAMALNYSAYSNQLIESGDFLLFTNASQWTTSPDTDNLELTFDGTALQILLVEKDADNAAYIMTVRRK